MPTRQITLTNKLGLHARAAAKFVGIANRHGCTVHIGRSTEALVDGKNIMQVMMLAASCGTEVCVSCEGEQAEQAMHELIGLIEDRFGEGE
ncbi:MAG: HPr family phosphocarrier protein [Halopseudomonas yangmingensis]|uniref:Phosphocarrier protein n=1 Tax=Halopseudomonas yangmingensis TaxID=1720063 RepID=A0A1I4N3J4_9GAMM|nr:HPr family phosphocarrier protein [Halopseudomonas yangmingensis]SFM09810.1 phosphocarrier protein [Halopseudomonas yangmingensis]